MADDSNLPLPNLPLGQSVINATSPDQQQAQQAEQGSTQGQATQPAAKAPKMGGQPLLYRYISEMIKGQAGGQPISRGDASLNFLGEFLGNLAGGLANAGHGPGANLRGFAGAVQAPYQRNLQDFQVQQQANQQQAQIEQEQARTAQIKAQSEMVQTPAGMLPAALAASIYGKGIQAQATVQAAQQRGAVAAQTAATSRENVADTAAQSRIDVANIAANTKANAPQTSKVDPIIAAQAGLPPDPTKYAGGKDDPKYKADAQAWGTKAEAIKNRMAGAAAAARGQAYGSFRPVQAIDPDTGESKWMFGGQAVAAGAAPAGAGAQAMSKQAQFQEIKTASAKFRDSIQNLDRDFTPEQRVKLNLAMHAPSQSSVSELRDSILGTEQLTPKQQDFVIWATQMHERVLSLRSVAGMGQGSESMRAAIQATVPGVRMADKQYGLKQLDALDQQVSQLEKGIPKVKGLGGGTTSGTVQYRLGDKVYNIPAAQEKEFLKDKPAATKVPGASR